MPTTHDTTTDEAIRTAQEAHRARARTTAAEFAATPDDDTAEAARAAANTAAATGGRGAAEFRALLAALEAWADCAAGLFDAAEAEKTGTAAREAAERAARS